MQSFTIFCKLKKYSNSSTPHLRGKEHFTPSLVVSHFSTQLGEAWLFEEQKIHHMFILFLIQSWGFVNKNPSIIKPRQFLIKSGQLTALEKQWNLSVKGNFMEQDKGDKIYI